MRILDGGMGTILHDRFNNHDRVLWSLKPYFDKKENIIKAHQLFLDNGADIIITNNYCATSYYLKKGKINLNLLPEIISNIGLLAKQSIKNYKNKKIFGSIPPYSESYNTKVKFSKNDINKHYYITYSNLNKYVDKFIFETVSSLNELYIILEFINKYGINDKTYISFCVNKTGKELLDKSNLKYVIKLLNNNFIEYIFLNCSPINYIDLAIEYIHKENINIGVYPNKHRKTLNNFELNLDFNKMDIYKDISKEEFLNYAKKWKNKGVSIIGGCCGIDEFFIKQLKTLKQSKL